ncbi:MAG: hypothetical protein KAU29_01180 [Gammaproteobacteria bacterium]|nr:hypothetical protein [Gammaproteobacteria bacterium]
MEPKGTNYVVVTDINMSFISMVIFMVKWVVASIPAFIILSIIGAVFMMLFGGIMSGIGGMRV